MLEILNQGILSQRRMGEAVTRKMPLKVLNQTLSEMHFSDGKRFTIEDGVVFVLSSLHCCVFDCQFQSSQFPGKTCVRNDLLYVEWSVNISSLSHIFRLQRFFSLA